MRQERLGHAQLTGFEMLEFEGTEKILLGIACHHGQIIHGTWHHSSGFSVRVVFQETEDLMNSVRASSL